MRVILIILLFSLIYSLPNLVYVMKDCIEKLYNVNEDKELQWSIKHELLQYQTDEFYARLDKIDPTLRSKMKKCIEEVYAIYQENFKRLMRTIPDHFE